MFNMLRQAYNRLHEGAKYRLRNFRGVRWAHHCRPVSIYFMLTDLCNARCLHCDTWKNKAKGIGPTFEQRTTVLKGLRSWLGPVSICFSGGEALLVPFAIDLVAQAASLGLFVEVLTHGCWQDQSKIERLALAILSRVTVSLDGISETHNTIRGREQFFERTSRSIATLHRIRKEQGWKYTIRLKCVLMSHNLDDAAKVAEYAEQPGMEVFFQPIEQNYNTPKDAHWFKKSDNWPRDTEKAVATVQRLISLKDRGLPIANSLAQLRAMVPYLRDPASMRVITTLHSAHERKASCAALTTIQFVPNGDVLTCYSMPPVGKIKDQAIRPIWESRPRWWVGGCCLERRYCENERQTLTFANRS
jgi:MoaA/NifB/PqqE/SkfB family radical SAM enzyme